jgi:hypothetical protein
MGLLLQNNSIVLSDASGTERFSTDKEMPHLMLSASGSLSVGNVAGTASYVGYVGESDSLFLFTGFTASQETRHTLITHSGIVAGSESFITPFITVSSGIFQTGTGQVMSAMGSSILDLYIRNDGYFAGSTVLHVEVSAGKVELVIKSEVSISGNYTVVDHSYTTGEPPYDGQATKTVSSGLNNSAFNITYKIYYGRFN